MRRGRSARFGAALVALLLLVGAGALRAELRAGAAKRPITPDLEGHAPVFLAGFGLNRRATGIHDDLWARCLALEAGGGRLVICGVDSIGLFYEDVEKIRAAARSQLTGPADLVVASSHNHEAPDTMGLWGPKLGVSGISEAYNAFVVERTAEAAAEAVGSLRPATIRLARFHSPELDRFIHDNRPPVVHDSELVILSAAGRDGRPIATLVNWANHPEALGSKNTLVTADYPAHLYTRLEELLGGVAVFVNGAVGGMQSPLGAKVIDPATGAEAPDGTFRKAELIGRRVAELAAQALGPARPVAIERVEYHEKLISIPVTNVRFLKAAEAGVFRGRKVMDPQAVTTTPVGWIRLSRGQRPVLEIALVPGELYPELSVGGIERYPGADFPEAPLEPPIKKLMRAPYRMLFGLANDEIGYIIPKAEWDENEPWLQNSPRRWYGEVNSVGPEAAPRIVAALQELLGKR
ncbi:MAG: hypothetical protein NZM33_06820 [Bryobacteraceae bacterium]|nr:hypothetical protein [Bryobacteraceae bacterium]